MGLKAADRGLLERVSREETYPAMYQQLDFTGILEALSVTGPPMSSSIADR